MCLSLFLQTLFSETLIPSFEKHLDQDGMQMPKSESPRKDFCVSLILNNTCKRLAKKVCFRESEFSTNTLSEDLNPPLDQNIFEVQSSRLLLLYYYKFREDTNQHAILNMT